jgi:HTH-type transcriptional regulator, competence development regulator
MKETFGQILKELRRNKNISQRELADKVNVDFSYISKLENDRLAPPSAETIIRISNILDIPSEVLLSHSGKVSDEMKDTMSSSREALMFMNEAKNMNLQAQEWQKLIGELKKLR